MTPAHCLDLPLVRRRAAVWGRGVFPFWTVSHVSQGPANLNETVGGRAYFSKSSAIARTAAPMSGRASAMARVASTNPTLLPQSYRAPSKVTA